MGTETEPPVISRLPDVMSGASVFVGTRVPAQTLLDYIAGGHSLEEFLDDFPTVQREQALKLLWSIEIEKRIDEVESGKMATIPGDEVFDKIRKKFRG